MRKEIYKAIADRLKAAKLGIKYISLWNRNTEHLSKQSAFEFPAVFVEFEPIEWSKQTQGVRSADMRIRLYIVTETLCSPNDGGKYQYKALEHLDLIEKVSASIQGLSGANFNTFMLVESVMDNDHERIEVNQESFITRVTDTLGKKKTATVTGVKLVKG